MLSWEWYSDINVTRVFIHLLLNATYKDYPFQGMTIPRGGQITTYAQLSAETGLTKNEVRGAIDKLKSTGEITTEITRNKQLIRLCNYSLYQDATDTETQPKPQTKPQPSHTRLTPDQHPYIEQEEKKRRREELVSNKISKKEPTIPYSEIVEHLNKAAGKNYRTTTGKTRDLIKARHNEGFKLDDFKRVIDVKSAEWGKTDMCRYLRPETLFGTKFEGYLNQGDPRKTSLDSEKDDLAWMEG